MTTIAALDVGCYHVPLPVVLSDSTHGDIHHFALVTVRVRDADGAEGLGYTYTVGHGGRAVASLVRDDLAPLLVGQDAWFLEAGGIINLIVDGGKISFEINLAPARAASLELDSKLKALAKSVKGA